MSIFNELKRRNVLRVGAAYLAVAWLVIQITETIFPLFGLPDSAARLVVLLFAVGLVPVLVIAWVFEWTPQGLRKESDIDRSRPDAIQSTQKLDRAIMLFLALALSYFAFDRFVLIPDKEADLQRQQAAQLVALEQQKSAEVEQARAEGRKDALLESYGDKSIAVLPFVNMSDDAGNEYFADGISEELLNLLARVPELRVISRSSSFTFRGASIDIPSVAEQLHVAHVLEGSVRKSGNRVRITAQLIEADTDTHIWSATYDRTLDDIFAVQDEIAAEVVKQLKVKLLGGMARTEAVDAEVYRDFLQARFLLNRYDPADLEAAEELLRGVLERDADYVPALLQMATIYVRQYNYGQRSLEDAEELYRQTVAHARAVHPDDPLVLAYISSAAGIFEHDLSKTAPGIARAFELDPRNAAIAYQALRMARMTGRAELAIGIGEYLLSLDPLCSRCHFGLGKAYLAVGRYEDAEAMMRKTLILGEGWFDPWMVLGIIKLLQDEPQAALDEFSRDKDQGWQLQGRAMVMYQLGRQADFEAAFSQLQDMLGDEANAAIYAWTGDRDKAFEWLERRLAERPGDITEIFSDPIYQKLHDDPRWHPFLLKVGEAPEQLAAIEFAVTVP